MTIRPLRFALLTCLAFLHVPAWAEWGDFEFEFEQDKPWVEMAAQLPPPPKADNLIPFTVSSITRNRHYVDAASISVGADKVVRYTVVVEMVGGARNVSFEGLRCESAERRLYAYGQPDGSWSRARQSHWETIKLRSLLSYQKPLYEDFFCPDGIRVRDGVEAARNLRQAAQ